MRRRNGFTLAELMIAIGIIAILGAVTVLGVRTVSKDVKLSSGVNRVTATLTAARAMAMKDQQIVLVAFRSKFVNRGEMQVEAVVGRWTGETYVTGGGIVDRFVPMPGVKRVLLPKGVKVAGPRFTGNADGAWFTQAHLPAIDQVAPVGPPNEWGGAVIGVMFDGTGTMITQNTRTDATHIWLDLDNVYDENGILPLVNYENDDQIDPYDAAVLGPMSGEQRLEGDEAFIQTVPFLSIFDDDEARELRTSGWTTLEELDIDLTGAGGYITESGKRIHFNRYSGVVMSGNRG
ncbi:MAG: pilus assembly FimT family protein [Planctomycetota bacterium]|jgi:prepilin-type N-terminal cleavage/methylation domain-containing protein